MPALGLRFLGEPEVVREGAAQSLPPAKKTRALLAFLCLQPRRFRREQLSDLLWDAPDDPLGSLRWSLSKPRRLVDEPDRERLMADRTTVGLDAAGVAVDVLELHALAHTALPQVAATRN